MRRFLIALIITAAGLAAGAALEPAQRVRPNIVLIVMDAFRADRIGMVRDGLEVTPNLNRLASRGIVYENCYSPSSQTKISMASIFTGELPSYHGVLALQNTISKNCDTLAARLRRMGYVTLGVVSNAWLMAEGRRRRRVDTYGFHKGFLHYRHLRADRGDIQYYACAPRVNGAVHLARPPTFTYVHYMDVHNPRVPQRPRATSGLFADDADREARHRADKALYRRYMEDRAGLSPADHRRLAAIYDEAAHYLDDWVAKLIDMIRLRQMNTIFVITADHGELLNRDGRYGHGYSLYEGEVRVPLIIVGPGIPHRRVPWRVSNRHLFEWIPAMARGTVPLPEDHERIIAQVRSPNLLNRYHGGGPYDVVKIIEPDGWALTVTENMDGDILEAVRFDLNTDPRETMPKPADDRAVQQAALMSERLEARAASEGISIMGTSHDWQWRFATPDSRTPVPHVVRRADSRMLEHMKALGYLN